MTEFAGHDTRFQSSPDGYAGRYQRRSDSQPGGTCFNPRPTVMPGATQPHALDSMPTICFNPRPTVMPGATAILPRISKCSSFNPRPTVMPGATRQRTKWRRSENVSILARRLCRALHELGQALQEGGNVSILARRLCRALLSSIRKNGRLAMFQSSPDGYAGRYGYMMLALVNHCEFQSSPDGYAGRYNIGSGKSLASASFQSSPDGYAGRYLVMARPGRIIRVSILARRLCRALPAVPKSRAVLCMCFNPRPTVMPGATATASVEPERELVSILARRLCRALPQNLFYITATELVSILARRLCRALPVLSGR